MNVLRYKELYTYRRLLIARFAAMLDDLSAAVEAVHPQRWANPNDEGDQNPHYVLAHLMEIESQVLSARIKRILAEQEPRFDFFDDKAWMKAQYRPHEAPLAMLEAFIEAHHQILTEIKSLSPEGWTRTGWHPWFGQKTLQWWIEKILEFTESHLKLLRQAAENQT